MRRSALILVSLIALVACSPKKPPTAPASPAAAPAVAVATPAPVDAQPAPPEGPAPVTVDGPPIQYGPPPTEAVRFAPSDYSAKERRIAALINNAESRDTSGETQHVAERGRAERQHCATKACIEQSYAAEEARLRKWEGSSDIR